MLGVKAIARAKINLFLEVGDLREDGFHEVRSLMQSIQLADELYFRRTDGAHGKISIRCNEEDVPAGEENLVWRAIELFDSRKGVIGSGGIEVLINKKIPVGAGLAGGSADAAAALLAMDFVYELDLPREEIAEMASEVGSDVPFCLVGGTSVATGRGEVLRRLEPLPAFQVVLASTAEGVSTAEVYRRLDELRLELEREEKRGGDLEMVVEALERRDLEVLLSNLHNTLESATIAGEEVRSYKEVARQSGALAALMTGSGPTVFALVSGMEQAAEVAWELEKIAPITIITSFSERGAEISR